MKFKNHGGRLKEGPKLDQRPPITILGRGAKMGSIFSPLRGMSYDEVGKDILAAKAREAAAKAPKIFDIRYSREGF